MKPPYVVGDLSRVPAYASGLKSLWGWGLLGFVLVEGMAFVLFAGAYVYLMSQAQRWPLHSLPPELVWGALFTLIMIASQWPNMAASRAAMNWDARGVQRGVLIMSVIAVVLLIVRAFEFADRSTGSCW